MALLAVAGTVLVSGCTTSEIEPYKIPEHKWDPPPAAEQACLPGAVRL